MRISDWSSDVCSSDLVRPLLGIGRDELEAYAREQGLDWIEDPSNQCLDHSRNYLRHQVLPVIRQRWPRAAINMARAAAHLGDRKRGVSGKSVSVRVDMGGRGIIKKKINK